MRKMLLTALFAGMLSVSLFAVRTENDSKSGTDIPSHYLFEGLNPSISGMWEGTNGEFKGDSVVVACRKTIGKYSVSIYSLVCGIIKPDGSLECSKVFDFNPKCKNEFHPSICRIGDNNVFLVAYKVDPGSPPLRIGEIKVSESGDISFTPDCCKYDTGFHPSICCVGKIEQGNYKGDYGIIEIHESDGTFYSTLYANTFAVDPATFNVQKTGGSFSLGYKGFSPILCGWDSPDIYQGNYCLEMHIEHDWPFLWNPCGYIYTNIFSLSSDGSTIKRIGSKNPSSILVCDKYWDSLFGTCPSFGAAPSGWDGDQYLVTVPTNNLLGETAYGQLRWNWFHANTKPTNRYGFPYVDKNCDNPSLCRISKAPLRFMEVHQEQGGDKIYSNAVWN